jgi:glyoxylase-like metal-dependent hydrolase (beta-lactamase superfamily II)
VTYAVQPDDASAVRNGEAGWRADRRLAGDALFSGDVLFQGSVGRVDLPGGDWPTLLASIELLMNEFPPETTVYPGHMGITTLGRERATNPFLRELA